jgi:hypothetical protein
MFEPTPRAVELIKVMSTFLEENVYPAEARFEAATPPRPSGGYAHLAHLTAAGES